MGMRANGRHSARVETVSAASAAQPVFSAVCQNPHRRQRVDSRRAHRDGHALYLPHPMNTEYLHGVPKRKKVKSCRISLTFREIV